MSVPIPPPLCLRPGALDVPVPKVDPMRWDGASMDAAKFRTLPQVPGYRYELLDGTARIRPVDSPLILLAARTDDGMAPARPPASVTLRPPRLRDRDALVNLWTDLFAERPDHGRAGREHIRADAQKRVDALLDSSNEPLLDWACVAFHDGAVVGALLPDMFGSYPQIDVLFVAPDWQRRGVGTTLLRTFAQAVRADDAPCVVSTSHPANRASRGWHRAMGFCPLPSRPLIQHLRLCLQANLVHDHVPANQGRPAKTMLDQIADRLRASERKHPTAVHPIRWAQEDDALEQYLVG